MPALKICKRLNLHLTKIMGMKCNRLAALSLEDKHQGRFVKIDSLWNQIPLNGFI